MLLQEASNLSLSACNSRVGCLICHITIMYYFNQFPVQSANSLQHRDMLSTMTSWVHCSDWTAHLGNLLSISPYKGRHTIHVWHCGSGRSKSVQNLDSDNHLHRWGSSTHAWATALAQFVPHAMQSAISHMPCEPQYKHNPLTIGNVM